MKVYSFIPSDGSWKFSFNADLKVFFNYLAQNQGYPINNQNLIGKLRHQQPRKASADFFQSVPAGYRALYWWPDQVLCLELLGQRQRVRSIVVN